MPSPRTRMAGEDLLTEGTQVPEPRMVTLIPIALLYITDLLSGHILSKRADTGVYPYIRPKARKRRVGFSKALGRDESRPTNLLRYFCLTRTCLCHRFRHIKALKGNPNVKIQISNECQNPNDKFGI